jgi:ABC-type sugar transport system permease subunit
MRPPKADNNSLIGQSKALPYVLSGPAVFTVCALLAFPVLYALWKSLFRAEFLGAPEIWVGLENFKELFTSEDFYWSLSRSAIFVFGCLLVGIPLALFFAFALNRAVHRLRFFRGLSIAPYIVSSAAAAVMFRLLFNFDFGLINRTLVFLGLEGLPWLTSPTLAMVAVILAQVWTDLPLAILLILGGLQTIDPSLTDAATVDGADGWKRARTISMPLISPQIALGVVWLSYGTLTSLGVVLALTGSGPENSTQTLAMEMYETAFIRLETNLAMALVMVILALNAILTLTYMRLARRYDPDA